MQDQGAFPEQAAEGFAIAAIVHDDPGATLAEPGLAPDALALALGVARRLASQPKADRRAFLRAKLSQAAVDLEALESAPKRLRAALASHVDREVGRQWLLSAMPRAGYEAEPSLIRCLRALASRSRT